MGGACCSKRRRTARDEENDGEVARLTVYIIFAKKMLKVAEKMIKTADPKRRARRQADLLGLWLERDSALDEPTIAALEGALAPEALVPRPAPEEFAAVVAVTRGYFVLVVEPRDAAAAGPPRAPPRPRAAGGLGRVVRGRFRDAPTPTACSARCRLSTRPSILVAYL